MDRPDLRPLPDVFPTANGHRLRPCPWCKTLTTANADGVYTCYRSERHGPDCMFPRTPVSW